MNDIYIKLGCFLNSTEVKYAFLGDPKKEICKDIDIIIGKYELENAILVIKGYFDTMNCTLFNVIKNSYSVQLFFLSKEKNIIQIDVMPEISFRGLEYLNTSEILKSDTCVVEGVQFVTESFYSHYLLLRGLFQYSEHQLQNTSNRAVFQPNLMPKIFKPYIDLFEKSFDKSRKAENWFFLLKKKMISNPAKCLGAIIKNLFYKYKRRYAYNGLFISILGPDGVGKSTVIEFLKGNHLFKNVDFHYLLPCFMERYKKNKASEGVNTDPHGKPMKGKVFSILKQLIWLYEYIFGYFNIVRPRLEGNELVVFDRYYTDMSIDPIRYRYSGPIWLLNLCDKVIPSPDLIVVLYAETQTIQDRKSEVSFEETSNQLLRYKRYSERTSNCFSISTERSTEAVSSELNALILSVLNIRASKKISVRS
jgi:thymidylate kinase